MLDMIRNFIENRESEENSEDSEHKLKLATAVLMIEMMNQDGNCSEEEVETIKKSLENRFELDEKEVHDLFMEAGEEARQSVDFFKFTSLIHKHYELEEKIKIIEYLWMIAFSDEHLDAHEEHLVRRIADLLYVPHVQLMQTKHKVQEKLFSK